MPALGFCATTATLLVVAHAAPYHQHYPSAVVQGVPNIEKERCEVLDCFRVAAEFKSDFFKRCARKQSRLDLLALSKLWRVVIPVRFIDGCKLVSHSSEPFFAIACGQQFKKHATIRKQHQS